ncbi:hypothetical protein DM02DRAFT_552055 [Periconia macrospinosa]|uniref:Adenylyltransferase and sulfurtransferase uba4 n=1 Tax=Periconia macrospinosa TaxID=97972 RepID=A0A2V1EBM4_9PLEO|nr:hypothetical protein DM02DRAFT_552055 [Periconia macrospinosa]
MDMTSTHAVELLKKQIASHELQLDELKRQLAEAQSYQPEQQQQELHEPTFQPYSDPLAHDFAHGVAEDYMNEVLDVLSHQSVQSTLPNRWPLSQGEYRRYGRQLIMPEIGLQGQLKLKNASVLIIGVGGLGCPAASYLVGAGVGTLGLVDEDVVEESNLHRQILHSTARVGMSKVDSALVSLQSLNPNVKLVPHRGRLTPETAISTVRPYDIVLDCTDTPASRYLISDTCVLLGKPLVSASALRIDGQMMVLNNPPRPAGDLTGGPCYRCIFPKPPPPESVVTCGDGGILGPVVGVMGVLQALETIKVLTRTPSPGNEAPSSEPPTLLIFSAYTNPMFRSIRLRSRKAKCAACSPHATITPEALNSGSLDYVQFCGIVDPVNFLSPEERISAENYAKLRMEVNPYTGTEPDKNNHILVDVREKVQFEIGNIEGSVNIPFSNVSGLPVPKPNTSSVVSDNATWVSELRNTPEKPIFVVCQRGNDSQVVVKKLKELGLDNGGQRWIGDIKGGLVAWREKIDRDFPEYY